MGTIIELFSYDFFIHAFWASLFAAISCGIVGTYIVSRRIVFVSGGITHASFGGIGIGYFLGWNPLLGAAIFAILSGLGIQLFTEKAKVREDSSIAIWWSLGMAIGIIFVYLTPGYAPNLMSYLFGSVLTVSVTELWLMGALSIILILFFVLFYRLILYVAFDEEFAKTTGLPVSVINYLLISLIAITIVLNIRVVGIILILSLLTLPQATANLFTKDFKRMLPLSVLFAFIGAFVGLLFSFFVDIPSGASIIFTLVLLFGLVKLAVSTKQKLASRA
ncbi:metal ABC transporter permease [Sunxiuqinia elliptica]|uniref:Zinc transport system permease protein n=1 Tax=Sunxiuqinia elliptica TaxID=655355 RepID=A0A4R6H6G3_9BACT|nr:metal ABC transporter permease [Sunxiuqinia elliptica]TDO03923.1 zinc transport system permease protein [Sunxiuqinia elliptica]TDO62205.1 zinc transport system permease protein [Sunxiuqinia elliptica]